MKTAAMFAAILSAMRGAQEQEPAYAMLAFVFICLWALLPFPQNGRPY